MNLEMMEALEALASERGIPLDALFAALADACTEFGVEVPSSLALH